MSQSVRYSTRLFNDGWAVVKVTGTKKDREARTIERDSNRAYDLDTASKIAHSMNRDLMRLMETTK